MNNENLDKGPRGKRPTPKFETSDPHEQEEVSASFVLEQGMISSYADSTLGLVEYYADCNGVTVRKEPMPTEPVADRITKQKPILLEKFRVELYGPRVAVRETVRKIKDMNLRGREKSDKITDIEFVDPDGEAKGLPNRTGEVHFGYDQ